LGALILLGRKVGSSLSLETVVAFAMETILGAVKCDIAFLFLRDGERLTLAGIAPEAGREILGQIPEHRVGECMCGLAVRLGQPLYSRDIFTDARCTWEECKRAGLRSFAALPLRQSESVVGVLGLASRVKRDFSSQAGFLEAIAGTVASSLGNARLFAEAKRVQEALRASEEHYRLLFRSINDAIFVCRIEPDGMPGRFIEVNDIACRRMGYTREEMLQMRPLDLAGKDQWETYRHSVIPRLRADRHAVWEGLELTKDGREVPVEVSCNIFDYLGARLAVTTVRDITERRQAEQRQRQLEAQVQQAQKMESLGILAGGIAHDFNNLLTVILGHANLALMELAPESPARDSLREIEKASGRAAELCRQMLAYAGKGRFVMEPINLSLLIEEQTHLLQVSISSKILLRCQLPEELPAIDADPAQLRQVAMNLVINAAEAIGDKEGVIGISTGVMQCRAEDLASPHLIRQLAPGPYVYLEVTDTGCGMDAQIRNRIFDPFFTTKFAGRGLGLAAVLGIVRSHRGTLKVESERGRGTTFRVLFPASGKAANTAETGGSLPSWRGAGTILLVDDEEPVRIVTERMLERCGFSVLCASDGLEALQLYRARASEIVCVLLDLAMPRMDGEQTFRELRRIQPDVRVVLASGYSDEEIAQRFHSEGLAGFIAKPYRVETLGAKLREVLPSRGPVD
jgi:PAS domain S-box-containing protein